MIFFADIEILFSGNPECNEDEMREVLNWKREETHDQMYMASENQILEVDQTEQQTFDQMSDSSHNGNSEDDLMDILNIPKDHLLDQSRPRFTGDRPLRSTVIRSR